MLSNAKFQTNRCLQPRAFYFWTPINCCDFESIYMGHYLLLLCSWSSVLQESSFWPTIIDWNPNNPPEHLSALYKWFRPKSSAITTRMVWDHFMVVYKIISLLKNAPKLRIDNPFFIIWAHNETNQNSNVSLWLICVMGIPLISYNHHSSLMYTHLWKPHSTFKNILQSPMKW